MKNLKCQIVEKTSQKGNKYTCLEIYLTDNYKKIVFLDSAEIELLKVSTDSDDLTNFLSHRD